MPLRITRAITNLTRQPRVLVCHQCQLCLFKLPMQTTAARGRQEGKIRKKSNFLINSVLINHRYVLDLKGGNIYL